MSPVWLHRLGDDTGVNRAAIFGRRSYSSCSRRSAALCYRLGANAGSIDNMARVVAYSPRVSHLDSHLGRPRDWPAMLPLAVGGRGGLTNKPFSATCLVLRPGR